MKVLFSICFLWIPVGGGLQAQDRRSAVVVQPESTLGFALDELTDSLGLSYEQLAHLWLGLDTTGWDGGFSWEYELDSDSVASVVQFLSPNPTQRGMTRQVFDYERRRVRRDMFQFDGANGSVPVTRTTYEYDDDGRLRLKLTSIYRDGVYTAARRTLYDYDADGRQIRSQSDRREGSSWQTSITTTFQYDELGREIERTTTGGVDGPITTTSRYVDEHTTPVSRVHSARGVRKSALSAEGRWLAAISSTGIRVWFRDGQGTTLGRLYFPAQPLASGDCRPVTAHRNVFGPLGRVVFAPRTELADDVIPNRFCK